MKRYEHYMYKLRKRSWPPCVISVSCTYTSVLTEGPRSVEKQYLNTWYAVVQVWTKNGYIVKSRVDGRTADAFWDLINWWARNLRSTLILSSDCEREWQLLGLWKGIESESLQVSQGPASGMGLQGKKVLPLRQEGEMPQECSPVAAVHGLPDAWFGVISLSDGAKSVSFRFPGSKNTVRWIDVNNYGINTLNCWSRTGPPEYRIATWMADFERCMDSLGASGMASAVGGQAMAVFKQKHLRTGIYCHQNAGCLKLEEESLYGGRCECFRLGYVPEDVYQYDFRSAYPFACANTSVPVRLLHYIDGMGARLNYTPERYYRSIARVTIETDEPAYPLRRAGITIFPTGLFSTTIGGQELEYARIHGHIRAYHAIATYACEPALRDYAIELYAKREEADRLGKRMLSDSIKRMLVALPGKFVQRQKEWVTCEQECCDRPYCYWYGRNRKGEVCQYRCLGWVTQRQEQGEWTEDANPAISAFITAAARMRLWDAIKCAGRENVFYVDTDSLFVNQMGAENLTLGGFVATGKLGYLQRQHGPARLELFGIKHYSYGDRTVCAGVQLPGGRDDSGESVQAEIVPLAQLARKGRSPDGVTRVRSVSRTAGYRHGKVLACGRVSPFNMSEDQ